MDAEKVRNTYKNRAAKFFNGNKEKIEKFQKYFNYDNEDLLNLLDSPKKGAEEKEIIQGIIDFNRVNVKSKSDTNGKSNLPFSKNAIEVAQNIMLMRAGDMITIAGETKEKKELVSVQILVKYKDEDGIKTKSLDKHGNGIIIYI